MKNILLLIIALFAIQTIAQEIKFESNILDFGKIKKDVSAYKIFKFKNVGDIPLNIKSVLSSCCGCSSCSLKPIFPGETGKVKVKYYWTDRLGPFSKSTVVHSDAKNKPMISLTVKGTVVE